ncbi:MAG: glycine cleavage system protein GcvH [Methanobacteriota archaeon]|mgnify:FL=1|nr:MAG: glycine cleavage system protein GcvH [Euryarchaeota archaeon]|tara:strand:- start:27852 stop:28238 length:387 start_codon:yes stop_codon:yes gene_type:complete
MSEVPEGLYYTEEHEWVRIEDDGSITVGITDHAQNALTDIVYVELPENDEHFGNHDEFAIVESVKSASPIFVPFSGTIISTNLELEDAPELVNQSPYKDGWIAKFSIENIDDLKSLMSAEDYKNHINE